MGIQTLSVLVGGPSILEYHIFQGTDPKMMPLDFTSDYQQSRLFSSFPDSLLSILESENVTTNFHHDGIDPSSYSKNSQLKGFFHVLSTNKDALGRPFVSTIEAWQYPIYGVQWHPERPQYDFSVRGNDPVNHSADAVLVNFWTAYFFVNECRLNSRQFASRVKEQSSLIYNFQPKYRKSSNQPYFFPISTNDEFTKK